MSRDSLIYSANVAMSRQQSDDGSPSRRALRIQAEAEFVRLVTPLVRSIRGNILGYAAQVMHQRLRDGRMMRR